jgi:hypothetical protein
VVPLVSQTYVNSMFPESHHFVVIFSKGSFIQPKSAILQLISLPS